MCQSALSDMGATYSNSLSTTVVPPHSQNCARESHNNREFEQTARNLVTQTQT